MNVLLVGESTSKNLGAQAIFVTLKFLFEKHGFSVDGWDLSRYTFVEIDGDFGNGEVVASGSGPRPAVQAGSSIKMRLLDIISLLPGFAQKWIVYVTKKRAEMAMRASWRRMLRDYDLVVFGGGALLQDVNWSFPLALVHLSRAARAVGCPYVCVGVSSGSHFSHLGKRWLREFLDDCRYIALRDDASRESLGRIGSYDADTYVDSALLLASVRTVDPGPRGRALGINVIGETLHLRLGPAAHRQYLADLAGFVREEVILFTTGQDADHDAALQLAASAEIKESGVRVRVAPPPATLQELCTTIAGLDVVISSRLHAGILAKSFGCALIAIGWDNKVRGFCDMLGISANYVDSRKLSSAELAGQLRAIVAAGIDQPDRVSDCVDRLNELPKQLNSLGQQLGAAKNG